MGVRPHHSTPTIMTITLNYNESKKVYQCTGNDALKVWEALELNEYFKIDEGTPVIVHPKNLQLFTTKMKENYNIDVITNY